MKKINKINLSGVEHLSEQDAKEYVAECNSSENIQTKTEGDSGDSGGNGNSGDSGGSGTSGKHEVIIMPECEGKKVGDICYYNQASGTCQYRKVVIGGTIIKDYGTALTCLAKGNPTSGTELSGRELSCVGKQEGDGCDIPLTTGGTQRGICIINKWGLGSNPLFCAEHNYDRSGEGEPATE